MGGVVLAGWECASRKRGYRRGRVARSVGPSLEVITKARALFPEAQSTCLVLVHQQPVESYDLGKVRALVERHCSRPLSTQVTFQQGGNQCKSLSQCS